VLYHHYYKRLAAGCGLIVVLSVACNKIPDEVATLHRQASVFEQTAVASLDELTADDSRTKVSEIRDVFEQAAGEALELRERLRDRLREETSPSDELTRASQLNDDLLRCHQTLKERAEEAFQFVASGRARRSSMKGIWGIVDPRRCFDELAPAWDALLS